MKTLIVCQSYHHGNTKKIADAMAAALRADVVSPRDVNVSALDGYDLIGFGSGIAFGKHYKGLLKWVDGSRFFIKRRLCSQLGATGVYAPTTVP